LVSSFFKYQGAGNDFVLFEDYSETFPVASVPFLCHRRLGIGADGVLLLQPSSTADVKMRIFNEDGSEATMCGNGLRAVVHHLGRACTIETKGGICLGEPGRATLPKKEILERNLILNKEFIGNTVNTGTPHLVIFTEKEPDPEVTECYRNHFNVNWATPLSKEIIKVRTFEKGVTNETLACGTGGAAVALLLEQKSPVTIVFAGATLTYSFDPKGNFWMEGPTKLVFHGQVDVSSF